MGGFRILLCDSIIVIQNGNFNYIFFVLMLRFLTIYSDTITIFGILLYLQTLLTLHKTDLSAVIPALTE